MEKNIGKKINSDKESIDSILYTNTKNRLLTYSVSSFKDLVNISSNVELDELCAKFRVSIGLPNQLKREKLNKSFVSEKSKSNIDQSESGGNLFDKDGVLPVEKRRDLENWLRS